MSQIKYQQFNPDKDCLNYDFRYNPVETEALHTALNKQTKITLDDLRRVSLWKTNRVLDISEGTLKKLEAIAKAKQLSVGDSNVRQVIEELVDSQGVGYPMASAILKFIRPDVFPIIDVRAYRALTGRKLTYSQYSYDIYKQYTKLLTELAIRYGHLTLADIDEQLYCYDKQFNGKI